jgi:hypothetical protein
LNFFNFIFLALFFFAPKSSTKNIQMPTPKKQRTTALSQEDGLDEIVEFTSWARPALPEWDQSSMPVQFQQVETDHYINVPPTSSSSSSSSSS